MIKELVEYQSYLDKQNLLKKLDLRSEKEIDFKKMLFILFGEIKEGNEADLNKAYSKKKNRCWIENYIFENGFWNTEEKDDIQSKIETELRKFNYDSDYNYIMADIIYEFFIKDSNEIIENLRSELDLDGFNDIEEVFLNNIVNFILTTI